jgi:hypothetical protein
MSTRRRASLKTSQDLDTLPARAHCANAKTTSSNRDMGLLPEHEMRRKGACKIGACDTSDLVRTVDSN